MRWPTLAETAAASQGQVDAMSQGVTRRWEHDDAGRHEASGSGEASGSVVVD